MGRRSDVAQDARSPSRGSHRGWVRRGGEAPVERGSGGRSSCPAAEGRKQDEDTYLALAPPLSVLLYWAARP